MNMCELKIEIMGEATKLLLVARPRWPPTKVLWLITYQKDDTRISTRTLTIY